MLPEPLLIVLKHIMDNPDKENLYYTCICVHTSIYFSVWYAMELILKYLYH